MTCPACNSCVACLQDLRVKREVADGATSVVVLDVGHACDHDLHTRGDECAQAFPA